MPSTVEERKEIRRVLRNYAVHLELEEEEPPLTPDEEECIAISRAELAEGKGRPFKDVLNEPW